MLVAILAQEGEEEEEERRRRSSSPVCPSSFAQVDHSYNMVSLDTFVGDWRDALGNDVRATLEGPSGILLEGPNGGEVVLTIKRLPDGRSFECGHFLLDRKQITRDQIVWRDKRFPDRTTVWKRKRNDDGDDDGVWKKKRRGRGRGRVRGHKEDLESNQEKKEDMKKEDMKKDRPREGT